MTPTCRAFWLLLGLLPGSWACARAPYHYQPLASTAAAGGTLSEAAPQLLFLSFRMSTVPPGPRRLELLQAQAVPGEANALAEDVDGPAYLQLTQLDAAGRACGPPQRVPHPLRQSMEYPAEGSTGRLERREVTLPEAEFFVRVARQPRATAVHLEEVGTATPAPVSATFSLPL